MKEDFECKKYLHEVSDMGSKLLFRSIIVTRKAKTDLMALEIFDRPSPFNPLVHDDSLLRKFIILYLCCTMMQIPGNQVYHHPVKDGCVATS